MIENKIFLATSGSGLARAEQDANGEWSVTLVLEDEEAGCVTAVLSGAEVAVSQTPTTLYVGTQGNGIFRSDDRGQSWRPSGLSGQIVKSLAVSPHDPNIIYAGTKPACIYISRDGGASWAELDAFRRIRGRRFWFSPAEPPDKRPYVQAIIISPTQPDLVMAGIEFGAVVRSEDGGNSWSNHLRGTLRDCHNLKFHATNGDWVYEAGGGGAALGRENGRFWRKVNANLKLSQRYGVACAADPPTPRSLVRVRRPQPQSSV